MLQDFCYENIELLILEEQHKNQQQEPVQFLKNKRERSKTKSIDSRINIVPVNISNKISEEEEKRIQYELDEAGMTKCEICWRNFMIACSLVCCAASTSMFIYGLAVNISK